MASCRHRIAWCQLLQNSRRVFAKPWPSTGSLNLSRRLQPKHESKTSKTILPTTCGVKLFPKITSFVPKQASIKTAGCLTCQFCFQDRSWKRMCSSHPVRPPLVSARRCPLSVAHKNGPKLGPLEAVLASYMIRTKALLHFEAIRSLDFLRIILSSSSFLLARGPAVTTVIYQATLLQTDSRYA